MTNLDAVHRLEELWAEAGETRDWFKMSKLREIAVNFAMQLDKMESSAAPEAAEMAETLKRLRSQIPGCDCDNPAQCWESCGTLGHSEEHMKVIKDSNKP